VQDRDAVTADHSSEVA